MAGWNHDNAKWKEKSCVNCGNLFTPKGGFHKFCCEKCKGEWKYKSGQVTTESQYTAINGNWKRYLSRLLYSDGRKRGNLTQQQLLDKIKDQNYLCALTGVTLTCLLIKGTHTKTNASLDRIDAGGPYTIDNIQIVCKAVNSFRSDLPVKDFIWWCERVVENNNGKK